MIQLATDPNASRNNWRPAPADGKESPLSARSSRSGHAWPFISRHADHRPVAQQAPKQTRGDSGS
jgi:hypothetical protein